MTTNSEHSVTKYLDDLKNGDQDAAQQVWERFLGRLIRLADRKLKSSPRKALNEEDVVQQAFAQFFLQVQQGRFPQLNDRNDLWQVLAMLVDRRAKDQLRKQKSEKRGGGENRGESIFVVLGESTREGIAGVPDVEPSPELAAEMIEQFDQRLAMLKTEEDRKIVLFKLQGHSNREIADLIEVSLRTVERRLEDIRSRWSKD
jgi:RNA polymerase sigma factor (sigma-70 family)